MMDARREPYSDDAESLSARLHSPLGRTSPKSPTEALQPETIPPPPARSRAVRHPAIIFLNFVLTVLIVGAAVAGGSVFVAKLQFERPSDVDQALVVNVARGSSVTTIAEDLQQEGVIASKWLFVAGIWLTNQEGNLKAGEYLIPARASMRDIMDTMVSGRGILHAVAIPEGLTSQRIVDRLRAHDVLVGEIDETPPEGSLLPETYKFTRGDTRESVIDRMRSERNAVVREVWQRRAADLPLTTPEELVILASIVEKETALADERSRVAAVFINRLRLNMRLQSDPTVRYALFKGAAPPPDFRLSRADLDTVSPYNTYTVNGLPPGPIANPGRASLEAVANPSRTRDLFFVADGTGGHAFAETYEEHLRNVARWRAIKPTEPPADGGGLAVSDITAAEAASAAVGDAPADGADAGNAPMALSPTGSDDNPIELQPRVRPAQ